MAIYASVKVILVVGVALSLSPSPFHRHFHRSLRTHLSHVDHRARCRRRPRREAFLLLLSFSSALFFFARRSSLVAVVVVVVVVVVLYSLSSNDYPQPLLRHHYIDSACAQDCFALPSSFANKTKGPAFFVFLRVFKISRTFALSSKFQGLCGT